jgi:hypothetical protein
MELLHHGVDQTVIALWLGHESGETTQVYMHADMRLKEKALALSRLRRPIPDDISLAMRFWPISNRSDYAGQPRRNVPDSKAISVRRGIIRGSALCAHSCASAA